MNAEVCTWLCLHSHNMQLQGRSCLYVCSTCNGVRQVLPSSCFNSTPGLTLCCRHCCPVLWHDLPCATLNSAGTLCCSRPADLSCKLHLSACSLHVCICTCRPRWLGGPTGWSAIRHQHRAGAQCAAAAAGVHIGRIKHGGCGADAAQQDTAGAKRTADHRQGRCHVECR